ncbi:FecR domain-containing protein [Mucilaginibacter sp.]|uniref:FecR family protein n=1 Tax=Mucilaginibacter sp. TaxID=1882438 RepID=UPI003262D4EE
MDERYVTGLLKRFADNNCSDEEYLQIQQVFLDPEAGPIIEKFMDSLWEFPAGDVRFTRLHAGELYKKIIDDQRIQTASKNDNVLGKRSFYWAKVAASVLLVCMLAIAGKFAFFNKADLIAYTEYKTPAGKHLYIRLPDGSKVWLNAESNIRFPTKFDGKSRDIQLVGEAFFDVVHDVNRPFKVYTGYVCTQVLGTAFDISSYRKETIEITVLRGLVSVHTKQKQLGLLKPNQQLEYHTNSKTTVEHVVDAENYVSWTKDELLLNNTSLEEASVIISRRFNVNINLANPKLKKCRFVASFPANVRLNQVLKVLSKLNNFQYQINKQQVIISGNGCE